MPEHSRVREPLLIFVWQHGLFDRQGLRTGSGERVAVVDPGRRNPGPGPQFLDAEVLIDGTIRAGSIAVHEKTSDWGCNKRNYDPAYDGVILCVAADDDRPVRKADQTLLPSVELRLSERLIRACDSLRAGVRHTACGTQMGRLLNGIEFKSACTRLMIDRLERKYNDILALHGSAGRNWHETFHLLLFRTMGLGGGKETYLSLARAVPHAKLCRERGEVENIEAMLFGVAGLLDPALYDEYKSNLSERFERLRHRHQLRVAAYCEWGDRGVRPFTFAPKRIAQLASLIGSSGFSFDSLLECTTADQAGRMFRVELSEYWKHSMVFGDRAGKDRHSFDQEAIDILMINLVVPILFAYGRLEGRQEFEERSVDMLYAIRPEKNRYTEGWRRRGVRVEHALASQALIQLSTEFCAAGRCTDCFLGIRVLRNSL